MQQQPFQQQPEQWKPDLRPHQVMQPVPQPMPATRHTVKFYKSWWLIQSNAGQLERDLHSMEREGWRLQSVTRLGSNLFLRRVIVTIWTR